MNRNLEMDDDDDDCLAFWRRNKVNLNKLGYPAVHALSVPAASSAVQRVFSHGGVILRPRCQGHREFPFQECKIPPRSKKIPENSRC